MVLAPVKGDRDIIALGETEALGDTETLEETLAQRDEEREVVGQGVGEGL